MKKYISFFALALALVMIFGCAPASQSTKLVLNEVTHSVFYAPLYAAIELGYFQEQGLSIELVNGGGADRVMTAVLAGQADIGLCGPEAGVYVYNEGQEDYAVVIGQMTKRDGQFLVGRAPEPDFKWESLKGKSIVAGRKGGMPEMTLEYVLRQNGLEPHVDLEVDTSVQFNLMGGAFEGGMGDYVTLYEPTASAFEQAGKGYILAAVGTASGELPATAFQVRKSLLAEKPVLFATIALLAKYGMDLLNTVGRARMSGTGVSYIFLYGAIPVSSVFMLIAVIDRLGDIVGNKH